MRSPLARHVGRTIAANRRRVGMSQTVFGQKLGVTQVTVSRWEAGWCVPDLARLMDICRLLEFDLAELDPLQVAS